MIDPMKLARMQAVAQALAIGASDAFAKGDRKAAADLFRRADIAHSRVRDYLHTSVFTDDDLFRHGRPML